MNKKFILVVFTSAFLLLATFGVQFLTPSAANPVIIRVPADYPTIQEAINAANAGDIVQVASGTYYEHVVINKSLSLIGENRGTTIIDGNNTGYAIHVQSVNNVNVKGFTIQYGWGAPGFWCAIFLESSSGSTISDNIIISNIEDAIRVHDSNVIISGNIIKDNRGWSIRLFDSSGSNISYNTISNNWCGIGVSHSVGATINNNTVANHRAIGIHLFYSANCVLRNNNMTGNSRNLRIEGDSRPRYTQDIDTSNTVNGKPVYYLINQRNLIIDPSTFPDIGYLGLINSVSVTVRNLHLTNNGEGVLFAYTYGSVIQNVNASNNMVGIRLFLSYGNTITNNTISNNDVHGVVSSSSGYDTISDNTISNNGQIGINLESGHNTVSGNTIQNNLRGIRIGGSCNKIYGNTIHNNDWGIFLDSRYNTIVGNNISKCTVGIDSRYVDTNFIYHNSFINNTSQAFLYQSNNAWDNGAEGNYWSDHNGTDQNGDGISDTPYVIDEKNQDNYPLMAPWSGFRVFNVFWEGKVYQVTMLSNSPIASFNFSHSDKQISFDVMVPPDNVYWEFMVPAPWTAFCNVTIPKALLGANETHPWRVLLDGGSINYTKVENATHTFIYFTYYTETHDPHHVQIIGTWVTPEFPAALILPLLIITALFATILGKMTRSTKNSHNYANSKTSD